MTRTEISATLQNKAHEQGATTYRIEKATGLTGQQIKAVMTGSKNYTVDTLIKVCDALGVNVNFT